MIRISTNELGDRVGLDIIQPKQICNLTFVFASKAEENWTGNLRPQSLHSTRQSFKDNHYGITINPIICLCYAEISLSGEGILTKFEREC